MSTCGPVAFGDDGEQVVGGLALPSGGNDRGKGNFRKSYGGFCRARSAPRSSDITAIALAAESTLIATLLLMGVATFLVAFIAAYILCCAILSLISTAMLRDYTNRDISQEYDRTLRRSRAV